MNVLNAIVHSSDDLHCVQYELLKHPLVGGIFIYDLINSGLTYLLDRDPFAEAFLNLKWKHYRKSFHLLVLIYSVFVLSFSTLTYGIAKGYQLAIASNATLTQEDVTMMSVANGMVCFSGAFLFIHAVIQVMEINCKVHHIHPCFHQQITYLPLRKLIWDLELLLNLIAAFGAVSISIYSLTKSQEEYFTKDCAMLHHLASWIVLIVWTNLMLLLGRLPKLGCYSLMLTTVTKNFLKVTFIGPNGLIYKL